MIASPSQRKVDNSMLRLTAPTLRSRIDRSRIHASWPDGKHRVVACSLQRRGTCALRHAEVLTDLERHTNSGVADWHFAASTARRSSRAGYINQLPAERTATWLQSQGDVKSRAAASSST
jgi:hypothetical protein